MAEGRRIITSEEYARYCKLDRLLRTLATDVLRERFCSKVKRTDLEATLNQSKKQIMKINKHFKEPQKKMLFPKEFNQTNSPDVNEFDISLLALLLRYLPECKMNRKAPCWNWNDKDIDDLYQSPEAHIMRIKNLRNKRSHRPPSLSSSEFKEEWKQAEMAILGLGHDLIPGLKAEIIKLKTKSLDPLSPELKNLLANTNNFFNDFTGEHVVETSTLDKARELLELEEHHMLVLTGHPGEGKTTMAATLALEKFGKDRCLNIASPADWRHINLDDRRIDAVIIDDIFGSGALKQRLVDQWIPTLKEIIRAAERGTLHIIITTRGYILQNVRDVEANQTVQKMGDVELKLESKDLTHKEKEAILRNHAALRGRGKMADRIVDECVSGSSSFHQETVEFQFGFPECVDMFVKNDALFKQGSEFFKKPNEFFRKCLHELFTSEDEEKRQNFLALVTVWANDGKITEDELDLTSETDSEIVKRVSKNFGFEFKPTIKIRLQKALDQHKGGFIEYSDHKEEYRFSHNVIGDMVGIVISESYPKQTVEFCGRDFLLEYVKLERRSKLYCVPVKEKHYRLLVKKCTDMLLKTSHQNHELQSSFSQLQRSGKRQNRIEAKEDMDVAILRHEAFENRNFVKLFLDELDEDPKRKSQVFKTPVMKMSGFLFDYGIELHDETAMCLSAYSIYIGANIFFEELLQRKMVHGDLRFSLTHAVHSKRLDTMNLLLNAGVIPDGNAIYIAMHQRDKTNLHVLLSSPNVDINDRGNLVKGNYPIIVAARKGLTAAVEMLVENGANLAVKNEDKMSALDKAIVYKHTDISKLLIEHGAPLDQKHGKFRRTPLHVAADMGQLDVVKMLLKHGAPVKKRDHKNHYPIHCAAFQGHVDVVNALLLHDASQETLRITSFQKTSPIKGMTVFHLAVFRKNLALLKSLISLKIDPNIKDWYGQTPLHIAVKLKLTEYAENLIAYPMTDVDLCDKNGFTVLHTAMYTAQDVIVEQLCQRANVNIADKHGKTALHLACQTMKPDYLHQILRKGGDTRMITKRGDSVLHITRRLLTQKDKAMKLEMTENLHEIEKSILKHDPAILEFLKDKKNRRGQEVPPVLTIPKSRNQNLTGLSQQLSQLRFENPVEHMYEESAEAYDPLEDMFDDPTEAYDPLEDMFDDPTDSFDPYEDYYDLF